jgi:hypothetical protein
MEVREARIIEDFIVSIARRESRRYFGSLPTESGNIASRARRPSWGTWQPAIFQVPESWLVTLAHKTRWHEFTTHILVEFPEVHLKIDVPHNIVDNTSARRLNISQLTVNIADPESRKQIEQFLTETYKQVRNDMRKRRYLVRIESIVKEQEKYG